MNPQYPAAPAPPRSSTGRTCLFAFLGCAGVAIVLFGIFTVFISMRMKDAMKHVDLSPAGVAKIMGDVPTYPGMTLDAAQSRMSMGTQKAMGGMMPHAGKGGMEQLMFRAPKGGATAIDWYEKKLPALGWTESNLPMPRVMKGFNMKQFSKGDERLVLSANPVDSTVVQVQIMRGLPVRQPSPPASVKIQKKATS